MTPDASAGFEVPAAPGQRQLWLVQQLAPRSSAYHMPFALELDGALELGALRTALQGVVDRHEALRTRFVERDGTLFQVIDAAQAVDFSSREVTGADALHRESLRLAEAPFDLSAGPLLRCTLLRHAPDRARLVVVFHHLVADGWSLDVFAAELVAAYRAALAGTAWAPPELPLQYADLSEHQREQLEAGGAEAALAHFRAALAGAEPARAPSLPSSHQAPGQARVHRFSVSAEPVRALARARKTTPFAVLLAATQLVVQRLTGEAAPCVGTVAAGRDRPETHGLIGYFVNTLPLRDTVEPRASFGAVVDRAARTAQRAFDHQALPFDTLVQSLPVPRDERGQALFRVMLVLNPSVAPALELPGLTARGAELPTGAAKFDLVLSFSEAGEALHGHLEFDSRFHPHGIATVAEVLTQLLEHGPRAPEVEAARWLAATPAQAAQLDALEHGHAEPRDLTASVAASVERWVRRTPEALALRGPTGELDYRELWRRSGLVAAALGPLPADAVVVVWAPRSVEALVAVLGVVRAGGAYLAFDPALPRERARALAAAAGAKAVVASSELEAQARSLSLPLLRLDGVDGPPPPTAPGGQRLLYVAFTSGSTGEPKGVAVPHAAVQRLLGAPSFVSLGNDTRMLHAAPLAFDASTLEVWGPWLHGGAVVVAPVELSPASLEATLRDGAVTVAWLTSGLFQTLLDERPAAFAGLRWLLTGGDVVSPAHARRVLELVPGLRLVNGYGPTECTTFACCHVVTAPGEVTSPLPIGRPINRTRALILDDFGRRAPPGFEGELFLGGDGLARGYVSRPDLTADRFGPAPSGGERLYRTGDRARFDPDRAVQFLGRRDAQVKVRGHRIELAEVEALARTLPGVRDAVAFVVGDGVDTRALHAALVLAQGVALDEGALTLALRERAPAHLVPSRFWAVPAIPLGATGKPDRARLGRELLAHASPGTAERFDSPDARAVAQVFEELLGGGPLGPHDDFFLRGGHSLLAMRAAARLEERLGKPVSLAQLFEHPTPEALAQALARSAALTAPADFPREGPFPLSRAQQRLWFFQQLEPESAFYASYAAFHLERRLDVGALEQALHTLAARHEGLRVRFQLHDGAPRQVPAEPAWPLTVARAVDDAERAAVLDAFANTPFDLEREPPVRALWVEERDGGALLLLLHHLVTDGESMRLLLGELADLLAGRALEAAPASYRAFVAREAQEALAPAYAEAERHWAQALRGPLPVLELPRDFARPKVLSSAGATVSRRLDGEVVRALTHRAASAGSTPFAWLLAATGAYLGRLAGQDEVVVATPATARTGAAFARTQGFFANTIALRASADVARGFQTLAEMAHAALREAVRHQQVPFDRVVELALPERSTAHAPVAQVMLSVVEHGAAEASLAGVRATPLDVAVRGAAFELTLIVDLGSGVLHAEYATDLFEAATVTRWLDGFAGFLGEALTDPSRAVGQLPLLSPAQRHQVLAAGRGAVHPGAGRQSALALVAAAAARWPDALAVTSGGQQRTYGELWTQATGLAGALSSAGVRRGDLVGVCLERGVDLVAALLGVWRAGAAYVPLDPEFPPARLALMLDDARPTALVCDGPGEAACAFLGPRLRPDAAARAAPDVTLTADDPAYVIYTSGSTGRPKGVVVPQGALANLLLAMQDDLRFEAGRRWLSVTTISFDIAIAELMVPLVCGGVTSLVPRAVVRDGQALRATLEAERPRVLQATPTVWRVLVQSGWPGDPALQALVGGEATDAALAEALTARAGEVWNYYGPTETTVWSTRERLLPGAAVRIGTALWNTTAWVLDGALAPVPPGVVGQLYLGGDGVAHGYLHRPDLTAERFVPSPFDPGARLYATGDLVRARADGRLEWLGRADFQVKLNGHRIELGEVEDALSRQPGLAESAVAVTSSGELQRLTAYVAWAPGAPGDLAALQASLQQALPAAMVPRAWVVLPSLPRTPNGKVDRPRLPLPDADAAAPAPLADGADARALQDAITRVLGTRPGPDEAFFSLGLDSLGAMRVCAALGEAGYALTPRDLFEAPSVAQAAPRLVRREPLSRTAAPAEGRPLTPLQRALYFHATVGRLAGAYVEQLVLELDPALRPAAVRAAFDAELAAHPALWCTLQTGPDGAPVAVSVPVSPSPWSEASAGRDPEQEAAAERAQELDPRSSPRFRLRWVPGAAPHLVFSFDHLWLDGFSASLLVRNVALRLAGKPSQPLRAGLSAPPAPEAARARWAARLARSPQPARLLGRAGKLSVSLGEEQYLRLHHALGLEKARALEARLSALGVGWAAAAHAAWALVLSRHGNGQAVRFGTVVAGRSALADAQTAVGMFIDVLPVVVPVPESNGAPGWLREVQAELRALSSDEGTPREWLHAAAQVGATEALYESILVVDPALDGLLASAPGLRRTRLSVEWTGHPVHVSLRPTPAVELDLTLQRSAFTEEEGQRLLRQFATALEAVAGEASVGALDVLGPDEHALLAAQRDERVPPSTGVDYPAALAAAAADHPERLAVSDASGAWTAAQLEQQVGGLAGALRARGVRPETLVGVLANRDARFLALAAAILQAEGVYVPLDPSHPPARWREVAQRGRLSAVVVDAACAARLSGDFPVPLWPLESLTGAPPFRGQPRPRSLAYVLHTSGSTGAPKGAMAEHAGFLNHSDLLVEQLGLTAADVLAQTAPQSFDISVWQMLTPFTVGARVHVVATEVVRDPRALVAELERVGATVVQLVPSLLRAMVDDLAASGRARPLPALRWCIPTGEALPPELARDWFALFPHVPLLNAYGPAECSDDVTLAVLRAPLPPGAPMSIGRPVKGASLAVLDERGRAVPYGAPGELVLGGLVVGRGYLGAPDLTAERFVPDPARPGARRYRTGDLVRFDRDGELVFLGRVDHQVKIRGQRIELGEVEAALRRQPSVQDALALVTPHPSGEPHLAAYVVPAAGAQPEPGWEATLKRAVAQELTSAMVPSQLVRLERWPLTANGKVNRAALPPITWSSARAPAREAADELEQAVLEVARAQLGAPTLGPDDDFFESGGSSLLAVKVLAGLEQRLGQRLRLDAFFEQPSAAGLAALLRAGAQRGPVVTLRAMGARRPVVLLPGGLGEPAVFRHLAAALAPVRPVLGLELPANPPADLEALARQLAAPVRAAVGPGPLLLAGWSLGGALALALADALQVAGSPVPEVAILDGGVPGHGPADSDAQLDAALAAQLGLPPGDRAFSAARARFVALERGFEAYRPSPQRRRLWLLETGDGTHLAPLWQPLAGGGLEHRLVAGDHESMLRPPHVSGVAKALDEALAALDAFSLR